MSSPAAPRRQTTNKVTLTHPRGCGIRFDKRRCALYDVTSSRVIPGLLKGNQQLFYPRYSFSRATHTADVNGTFTSVTTPSGSISAAMARRTGVKRGTLLDTQLGRTTELFKKYKLSHGYFYDPEQREAWTKTTVPIAMKKYIARILPHTRACWHTMETLHLSPVAYQVPVGCLSMNRATMIDLVCVDNSSAVKRYIPIEIKSGFNNYYYKCTSDKMKFPFGAQTDCVFNQHQLQLLIGSELYRRSYWKANKTAMGTPLLMRFRTDDDDNVISDIHPLRQWATDALPAAVRQMLIQQ